MLKTPLSHKNWLNPGGRVTGALAACHPADYAQFSICTVNRFPTAAGNDAQTEPRRPDLFFASRRCCINVVATRRPVTLYLSRSEDLVAVRIARWSSPPALFPNDIGVPKRFSRAQSPARAFVRAQRDPAEVSENMNRISVIQNRL